MRKGEGRKRREEVMGGEESGRKWKEGREEVMEGEGRGREEEEGRGKGKKAKVMAER